MFPSAQRGAYKQTGQTAGFCISDFLRGLQQVAGNTLGPICLLVGLGNYFSPWTILSLTFSPLCALQPPPPGDAHHPAFSSRPVLPLSVLCCHLGLLIHPFWSSSMIPPPPPHAATISLTLGCTGKMCYLKFTPNSGTASLSSWPCHQIQLTDFRAPGKQPWRPLNYSKREQCNVAVISVQKGKRKTYSCIFTYLLQLQPEDLGFRGCVRQQHASALRLCYSMLSITVQRKESRSNDELLPVILLTLQFEYRDIPRGGCREKLRLPLVGRKLCGCLSLPCTACGAFRELYEFLARSCCPGAPLSFRHKGTHNSPNLSSLNTSLS